MTQSKISPQAHARKTFNKTDMSINSIRGVKRPTTSQSPKVMGTPLANKLTFPSSAVSSKRKNVPVVTLSGLICKANVLPKTRLKLNLPSTGESPQQIDSALSQLSAGKGTATSKINLSSSRQQKPFKSPPLTTPHKKRTVKPRQLDVLPSPELVINQPLEKCYAKTKQIAANLKLKQETQFLFRNGFLELELCKIIEKTYQLRVRQIECTGDGEIDPSVFTQIVKVL